MALWWLCGDYVFTVGVKPEILTLKVKFDLDGQAQSRPKTTGILIWSKFGDPSLIG